MVVTLCASFSPAGQSARDPAAVQEARGHTAPAGRRVQLPAGHRPVVPGEMPLQPRAERAVLSAPAQRARVRRPALRRPRVVQRGRVPGQEPRHAAARRRAAAHLQLVARECFFSLLVINP